MANEFLSTYKPKPTQAPVQTTTAPNYLGAAASKVGGVLGSLLKPPTQQSPSVNKNQFLSGYPYNSAAQMMGYPAKAPEQNIAKPDTNLPTGQIKTVATQPTGTTSKNPAPPVQQMANSGSLVNPNANLQTAGLNTTTPQYSASGGAVIPQGGNAPIQAPTPPTGANTAPQGQPSPYTVNNGLYGQLITGLANRSQQASPEYQQAQQAYQGAVGNLANFRRQVAGEQANISQQPIELGFQQGRQQVLTQKAAQEDAALQNAVNQQQAALGFANTQQGLQQQGLTSAAGFAAPQFPSYSSQIYNPASQTFAAGGGTLSDAVSSVAQKVQNGTMTYNDAVTALSGYGQGGVNALQQALGPGFNVAQSNTLAGQQGSIGPAYSFAKTALQNVQDAMGGLGIAQGTNIPGVNLIGNTVSNITGLGSEATRKVAGAVAEARNAYAQLLAASRGGTPTDYGNQAQAAIPDNPTPNDIAAAMANLETLGQAKVGIYGNPGASVTNTSPSGGSGGLFNW